MSAFFNLLTIALAAGVGATNSLYAVDFSETSLLARRSTSIFSLPFTVPQEIVSNTSFAVFSEMSNASDPICDCSHMKPSITEAAFWSLIKLLTIVGAFLLAIDIRITEKRICASANVNRQPVKTVANMEKKQPVVENTETEEAVVDVVKNLVETVVAQEQVDDQAKISDEKKESDC